MEKIGDSIPVEKNSGDSKETRAGIEEKEPTTVDKKENDQESKNAGKKNKASGYVQKKKKKKKKVIVISAADPSAAAVMTSETGAKGCRVQVSNTKKPLFFYLNAAKRYIKQNNFVELSALGMAIPTVVTISEILKKDGWATEKKIGTSTVTLKDEAKGRVIMKAKIEILLERRRGSVATKTASESKEKVTEKEDALNTDMADQGEHESSTCCGSNGNVADKELSQLAQSDVVAGN